MQCRIKAYTTINMTKWHCSRICINLLISTKTFLPSIGLLSERLSLVTCKQRVDHFTPMVWFDLIKWPFHFTRGRLHYSEYIRYCQKTYDTNHISSETHNWYVYATWEIEPQNLGFTQMTFQGGVEGQNILLILAPICFLWNNLWPVCRYITGLIQWLLEPGWDESTTFKPAIRYCIIVSTFRKLETIRFVTSFITNLLMDKIVRFV